MKTRFAVTGGFHFTRWFLWLFVLLDPALFGAENLLVLRECGEGGIAALPEAPVFRSIAQGVNHGLAVDEEGQVHGWGNNRYGALAIPRIPGIVEVAVTDYSSAVRTSDGDLYLWGNGSGTNRISGAKYRSIDGGQTHLGALRENGEIEIIELALDPAPRPTGISNAVAISVSGNHNLVLKEDGSIQSFGTLGEWPPAVPAHGVVRQVAAGDRHGLALLEDGTVLAWGDDSQGQLDVPSFDQPVQAVFAGGDASLAVLEDGSPVFWGDTGEWQWRFPESVKEVGAVGVGPCGLALATLDPYVMVSPAVIPASEIAGATLIAASEGIENPEFQWFFRGAALEGQTNNQLVPEAFWQENTGQFEVVVTEGRTPKATASAWILNPPEIVGEPPSIALETGESATFGFEVSPSDLLELQWVRNGVPVPGRRIPQYSIENASAIDHGTYELHAGNPVGAAVSRKVSVSVADAPVVTIRPRRPVYDVGATMELEAVVAGVGALTYQWFYDSESAAIPGATNAVFRIENAQPRNLGPYWVQAVNAHGESKSPPYYLPFKRPPYSLGFEDDIVGLPGTRVVLDPRVVGVGPIHYQWRDANGVPLPGFTSPTLEVTIGETRADYHLVASNPYGEYIAYYTLEPDYPLEIFATTGDQEAAYDEYIALQVEYSAPWNSTLEWFHDGALLEDRNEPSFFVQLNDNTVGEYRMRITDPYGRSVTSEPITVTLSPSPPWISFATDLLYFRAGEHAVLAATEKSKPAAVLEWKHDGEVIDGATDRELVFDPVTRGDQGMYSCTATNVLGTAQSQVEVLVVPGHPGNQFMAWGELRGMETLLTESDLPVRDAAVSTNSAALIFADESLVTNGRPWGPAAIRSFDSLGFSRDIRIRDVRGQVHSVDDVFFPPAGTFYEFDYRRIAARAYRGDFTIQADVEGDLFYSNDPDHFRHVIPEWDGLPEQFALTGDSAAALLQDGRIVVWGNEFVEEFPGPYVQVVAGPEHISALTAEGEAEVIRDSTGKNAIPEGLGTVKTLVAGGLTGTPGFSAALTASGIVHAWGDLESNGIEWAGPLDKVQSIWNSENALFVLADPEAPVPISRQPQSATIRTGETLHLEIHHPLARLSYQWLFNGESIDGAYDRILEIPNAGSEHSGEYQVRLNNGVVSFNSKPAVIQVDPGPPVVIHQDLYRRYYAGSTIHLAPEIFGSGPFTYQWLRNGELIEDATEAALSIPRATPIDNGLYQIEVENDVGRTRSATYEIEVRPAPEPGHLLEWNASTLEVKDFAISDAIEVVATYGFGGAGSRFALREVGTVVNWNGQGKFGAIAFSPDPIVHISIGNRHLLALDSEGRVHIFYFNYTDQVALPEFDTRVLDVDAFDSWNAALTEDGRLVLWGHDNFYRIYPSDPEDPIVELADEEDFLAVTRNNRLLYGRGSLAEISFEDSIQVRDMVTYWPGILLLDDAGRLHFVGDEDDSPLPKFPDLPPLRRIHEVKNSALLATSMEGEIVGVGPGIPIIPQEVKYLYDAAYTVDGVAAIVDRGARILEQPAGKRVAEGDAFRLRVVIEDRPHDLQWYHHGAVIAGATDSELRVDQARFQHAGDYFVRITTPLGRYDSHEVEVVVEGPPRITNHETQITASLSESASLDLGIIATGEVRVEWFKDGQLVQNPGSYSLEIDEIGLADAGEYRALIYSKYGVQESQVIRVLVKHPPILLSEIKDIAIREGDPLAISLAALVYGEAESILWRDGEKVLRTPGLEFHLAALRTEDAGIYQAEIRTAAGSLTTQLFRIAVYSNEPFILHQPENALVPEGSHVLLEVDAFGQGPLAYQWFRNGQSIDGAEADAYSIPSLSSGKEGVYHVSVSSENGETWSREAVVAVRAKRVFVVADDDHPVKKVPTSIHDPVMVAAGQSHALVLQKDGNVVAWGDNRYGQLQVPPDLGADLIVAGDHHSLACRPGQSPQIIGWGANHSGQIDIPPMEGKVLHLAANGDFSAALTEEGMLWVWGGGKPLTTYEVSMMESVTKLVLSQDAAMVLRLNDPYIEKFAPGYVNEGGSTYRFVEIAADRDAFYLLRSNGDMWKWKRSADSFESSVYQNQSTRQFFAHAGALGILRAGGSVVSVRWDNRPIRLVSSELASLPPIQSLDVGYGFFLALHTFPVILKSPESQVVNEGTSATFQVSVDSLSTPVFRWRHNGLKLPAATNANLVFSKVTLNDEGEYHVFIDDSYGYTQSSPASLMVVPRRPVFLQEPADRTVNAGEDVAMEVEVLSSVPVSFQWHFNGQPLGGATNSVLPIIDFNPDQVGYYSVIAAVDGEGPVASREALLSLAPESVIRDDTSGTGAGGWTEVLGLDFFGGSIRFLEEPGSHSRLAFEFPLPKPGTYRIAWRNISSATSPWMEIAVEGRRRVLPPVASASAPPVEWIEVGQFEATSAGTVSIEVLDLPVPLAEGGFTAPTLDALRVERIPDPPLVKEWDPYIPIQLGDQLKISLQATGGVPLHYRWFHEGEFLEPVAGDRLVIPAAAESDLGTYRALLINPDGAVWTPPTLVYLLDAGGSPVRITIRRAGEELLLLGPAGWFFEQADYPKGPYEPIQPLREEGVIIQPDTTKKFFRLAYPEDTP